MPIQRTPWIDDDGTGTTGTIINNAEKQLLYDQIDAYVGGTWINVAFNAANYTAVSGTWSVNPGNQITLAYAGSATIGHVLLNVQGVQALSLATSELSVTLPGLPVSTRDAWMPMSYLISGAPGSGIVQIPVGAARLRLMRDLGGTPWPAGPGGIALTLLATVTYAR